MYETLKDRIITCTRLYFCDNYKYPNYLLIHPDAFFELTQELTGLELVPDKEYVNKFEFYGMKVIRSYDINTDFEVV